MDEIYSERKPVATETNYFETQRAKRDENFAPGYDESSYPQYQRQQNQGMSTIL